MRQPYALACYPTNIVGVKVSPTKICVQYGKPEVKLRLMGTDGGQLPKAPDCDRYLPIPTHGVDLEVVAVGCQMPELEAYQSALFKAYVEYGRNHSKVYEEKYGKSWLSTLLLMYNELGNVLDKLEHDWNKAHGNN